VGEGGWVFSVGKLAAGGERYYLDSVAKGVEDYYLGVGEAPGVWVGSACGELGLSATVEGPDLVAVLGGRDPGTGEGLVSGKAAASGRVPGFDLTFSAPKSVSLLFALGDEQVSGATRDAHDRAVGQALGFLEAEAARVRRGHDGLVVEPAAGLVAAGFRHRSSRAGDPQLHTHVLVANVGRGPDGRWSALDARAVFTHGKTASLLYQAALRAELTRTLGVTWAPVHKGIAEVAGFASSELMAFSQRRVEIEAALAVVGASSARAAQAAALDTRQAKSRGQRVDDGPLAQVNARDYGVEPPALVEGWRRRGSELGVDETRIAGLLGPPREPVYPDLTKLAARLLGPSGLTEQASTFDRRDVLRALAAAHPDGADVATIRAQADWFLGLPGLVRVEAAGHLRTIDAIRRGDGRSVVAETGPRWTTADLLAVETTLLQAAWERRAAGVGVARPDTLAWAIEARATLAGEQKAMVERLCASGAGVEVVVGVAGAGKTFALDASRAAWEASGIPVLGVALSARAAKELSAGSGIESTTLARLLADASRPEGRLPTGAVVVVDEAAMVGTRTLNRLVELTTKANGKLVLVGDPRQLPEIDAGGAFNALARRLGASVLVENRRQVEGWERAALGLVRSGRAVEAVAVYGEHGRIHLAPSAEAARAALVADWWAARTAHPDEPAVMLAGRRSDIDRLNNLARAVRKDAGELTGPELDVAGRRFAVGDDILALANDRRLGVVNGDRGQVTAINAETQTVTVAVGERSVELPAQYLRAGRLGYGYAMTVYKAQGMTAGRTFTLGTDALSGEEGYVALSRGRVANHLYAVIPASPTRPSQGRSSDPLVEALARSRAQRLATEALPDVARLARDRTIAELEGEAAVLEAGLRHGLPGDRSVDVAPARYNVTNAQTQLTAANAARADLAARLEQIGPFHRAERAALTAQFQAADQAAAGWARTLAIHQPHLAEAEAHQARRQEWLQTHAGDLERHAALQQAVATRRDVLTAAAALEPPRWLVEALGAYPDNRADRRIWRDTAGDIAVWRERHGVTDQTHPLGPHPADPIQALAHRRLVHDLYAAARRLGHQPQRGPGQHLGVEQDRGFDLGL
jgi:conjugative relaxase-like TrwC/TraI family protein